jgi:hypothetical protein
VSSRPTASSPRTLVRYLTLPRPGDLTKAIILPLGFLLAAATTQWPSAHELARAAVVWFAVEYLAYQARYQWNDIRGFAADQAHPDRDKRGRLPGPPEKGPAHIAASRAVLGARLAAAVALVVVLPGLRLAPVLLPSVVAVFGAALAYEMLRRRAAVCPSAERPDAAVVALWLISGAGYCVRGMTGVVLGAASGSSLAVAVAAGLACWLTGIVFVTTRWAVESLPFARRRGVRLRWHAEPGHGRGHLLPLTRWIPQDDGPPPPNLETWRPLWSRCAWHAPWNVAYAAALPLAWLAGANLSAGSSPSGAETVVMIVALTAVWALSVRRPGFGFGVAGAIALLAVAAAGPRGDVAAAFAPATVCFIYLACVHQRLADVGMALPRLRTRARVAAQALIPPPATVPRAPAPAPSRRSRLGGASTR